MFVWAGQTNDAPGTHTTLFIFARRSRNANSVET